MFEPLANWLLPFLYAGDNGEFSDVEMEKI